MWKVQFCKEKWLFRQNGFLVKMTLSKLFQSVAVYTESINCSVLRMIVLDIQVEKRVV